MVKKRPEAPPSVQKPKRGQPTKYDPAFIPIVVNLVARGLTNQEIAQTLDVEERTLYNWRREHEDLAQALVRSKELIDAQVEASLLMKANGYERQVQKATASGKVVTVTEYFPPSDSAIQFWLRNRKPQEFREQRDVNVKHGVEQGFLSFLAALDAKAKAEREAGVLPPLLEAQVIEDASIIDDEYDEDLVPQEPDTA
jgi:transposase-like protein